MKRKKKKRSPYKKPSLLLILKKTIVSYDVGDYNYSFRKLKKEWQKQQDMAGLMKVPKMMTWTETSLQTWINVDPKKFTREKIEMVSRLDLCWQSSCVCLLWIPEDQRNRLMQKNCWLAPSSERKTQRKWLKCWKGVLVEEWTLWLRFSEHTSTCYWLPFIYLLKIYGRQAVWH